MTIKNGLQDTMQHPLLVRLTVRKIPMTVTGTEPTLQVLSLEPATLPGFTWEPLPVLTSST
jgi:hypothetical protein